MDIATIKQAFKDNYVDLGKDDYWKVQSSYVIYHKAIERLGAALKVEWDEVRFLRIERDECVIFVKASRPDKKISEWSVGEALIGANYKVSGKQASYVYAMAEKRAKDRVLLKLAGLHGAYSDDEAEDFRRENRTDDGTGEVSRQPRADLPALPKTDNVVPITKGVEHPKNVDQDQSDTHVIDGVPVDADGVVQDNLSPVEIVAEIKAQVTACETYEAVRDLMTTGGAMDRIKGFSAVMVKDVRDYASNRMRELGWPSGKKAQS